MEWVVTTAKTVDEAKDAALDELGVDEADAEFEVLEEPRQGLFGRQRGEARVRARVRPTAPRPKVDRRDRKRRPRSEGSADSADSSDSASRTLGSAEEPAPAARPQATTPSRGSRAVAGAGPRRRGGSAGAPTPGDPPRDRASNTARARTRVSKVIEERGTETMAEEISLQEQGELAREFLVGLADCFGAIAEVSVLELDEDTVEVRVAGDDLGLLVGNKGQTLAAVQELTRTVVQRHTPGRTGRLMVDVAGYRQRRREALERFTRQVADDVIRSGVPKVLEAMSAADRKVVHDTAGSVEGVRTLSEGEDPHRRVVLMPDGPV